MIIISIHIFPFEIDRLERLLMYLNDCFLYVDLNKTEILLHVTLNKNENLLKSLSSNDDKFIELMKKVKCETFYEIKNDNKLLGVNDHRRKTIQISEQDDQIIFLDSDLFFNEKILAHQIKSIDFLKEKHEFYIISPNTIRLWDKTWDILTHELYINHSFSFHKKANFYNIVNQNYGVISLQKINKFKWGGGWFNCISANLLKSIGIPKSFKGYGLDDTFVMECCKLMKKEKGDVSQYILKNMIVCEDIRIDTKKYFKENAPNFKEFCNKKFKHELSSFLISYKKETI